METSSTYKVPKGKLLKIALRYNQQEMKIDSVRITGDFFAYPEEAVEKLEHHLHKKDLDENALFDTISAFIDQEHVQFIGIDAKGLTTAIMRCIS